MNKTENIVKTKQRVYKYVMFTVCIKENQIDIVKIVKFAERENDYKTDFVIKICCQGL